MVALQVGVAKKFVNGVQYQLSTRPLVQSSWPDNSFELVLSNPNKYLAKSIRIDIIGKTISSNLSLWT